MSTKAARGTKRVCQSCEAKFYDLNRSDIVCPMCGVIFQHETKPAKVSLAGNTADDDDDDDILTATPGTVEIVPLEEADGDAADIPDLEDVVEIEEDDDTELSTDDEAFIEVEDDDSGDDVTGFVGGTRKSDEDV